MYTPPGFVSLRTAIARLAEARHPGCEAIAFSELPSVQVPVVVPPFGEGYRIHDPWTAGSNDERWQPAWTALQAAMFEIQTALATPTIGAFHTQPDGSTGVLAAIWWNTQPGRRAVATGHDQDGEPLLLLDAELRDWMAHGKVKRELPMTWRDVDMQRWSEALSSNYGRVPAPRPPEKPAAIAESAPAPAPAPAPEPLPVHRVALAEIQRWYEERHRDCPHGPAGYTEDEDIAAAKAAFPTVTRERVRELRRQFAPPGGRTAGRWKSAKRNPPK